MDEWKLPQVTAERLGIIRAARDLIGAAALAQRLKVSDRTVAYWIEGKRGYRDGVLAELRQILVDHRQRTGMLIQVIRAEEARAAGGARPGREARP